MGCIASQTVTGDGPITALRHHVADPLHTTLLHVQGGNGGNKYAASTPRNNAPPLRALSGGADDANPPGGAGGDPNSSGAAGRTCRRRCIWGDAVCRALLGDSWSGGVDCDEERQLAPELGGDDADTDDAVPMPALRRAPQRVWV